MFKQGTTEKLINGVLSHIEHEIWDKIADKSLEKMSLTNCMRKTTDMVASCLSITANTKNICKKSALFNIQDHSTVKKQNYLTNSVTLSNTSSIKNENKSFQKGKDKFSNTNYTMKISRNSKYSAGSSIDMKAQSNILYKHSNQLTYCGSVNVPTPINQLIKEEEMRRKLMIKRLTEKQSNQETNIIERSRKTHQLKIKKTFQQMKSFTFNYQGQAVNVTPNHQKQQKVVELCAKILHKTKVKRRQCLRQDKNIVENQSYKYKIIREKNNIEQISKEKIVQINLLDQFHQKNKSELAYGVKIKTDDNEKSCFFGNNNNEKNIKRMSLSEFKSFSRINGFNSFVVPSVKINKGNRKNDWMRNNRSNTEKLSSKRTYRMNSCDSKSLSSQKSEKNRVRTEANTILVSNARQFERILLG